MHEVYLYGSILTTDSYILQGDFPAPNAYAEVIEHHKHIGGETGIACAILSEYGVSVKADGYHLGTVTAKPIFDYFEKRSVDLSSMRVRDDFEGLYDNVFIDRKNNTRNCFGQFGTLVRKMNNPYNMPIEDDIRNAKCAGLDPFNSDAALLGAKYAVKHGVPYAVIDCAYDSYLANNCAVAAISDEFLSNEYPSAGADDLMREYMKRGDGLFIFTFGAHTVIYGRKGVIKRTEPYRIKALSTLGAGDSFKAGTIYGLYKGMDDDELVRFACATAGVACMGYPLPENLPTLEKVRALMETRK
ncbi:MAG: carbohydrate kinase family protein [Eubacteriales bacterium]|nr:carbohydrate kinase family protein [Eubacteriales bacterium]MDD3880879.1 carbohydrate kinase family protein [Eubacteriales bacterium]MDD4511754.1 carbohydrate kinase family protein [Eubacteriales bacterium]